MNKIIQGDCIEEMKKLEENSIDAIITDPPYGLEFMGKEWDKFGISEGRAKRLTGSDHKGSGDRFFDHRDGASERGRYSEMTIPEKTSMQMFMQTWAKECLRVLKPGGFLLSFGGTRTYHRMVCGIEDAGFSIRDTIMWIYGSGFPKSLDVGRNVDRVVCREETKHFFNEPSKEQKKKFPEWHICKFSEEGNNFRGEGTALKPAVEPIVVARKPLSEKNVALNVLKWGTGGINIDACRIEAEPELAKNWDRKTITDIRGGNYKGGKPGGIKMYQKAPDGRFPANVILDEISGKMLDEQSGECKPQGNKIGKSIDTRGKNSFFGGGQVNDLNNYKDKGGASRFFYCAKSSRSERDLGCEDMEYKKRIDYGGFHSEKGLIENNRNPENRKPMKNNHPTVKPLKLIQYLIKLVSKEGATVLDPFLGSGTTGVACVHLNRNFIGIEKEKESIEIANKRIDNAAGLFKLKYDTRQSIFSRSTPLLI